MYSSSWAAAVGRFVWSLDICTLSASEEAAAGIAHTPRGAFSFMLLSLEGAGFHDFLKRKKARPDEPPSLTFRQT